MAKPKNIQRAAEVSEKFSQTIATVEAISNANIPLVRLMESPETLFEAKIALSGADSALLNSTPCEVVVLVSNLLERAPVITGVVKRALTSTAPAGPSLDGVSVSVDGKKINVNAKEEVLLECGKSSIRLRRDGKIIIKGTEVVSRASGSNKIKGSSVNIN